MGSRLGSALRSVAGLETRGYARGMKGGIKGACVLYVYVSVYWICGAMTAANPGRSPQHSRDIKSHLRFQSATDSHFLSWQFLCCTARAYACAVRAFCVLVLDFKDCYLRVV